jgi:hypothetical protein
LALTVAQLPEMIGFYPLVAGWFLEHVGKPMPLQEEAWPAIGGSTHGMGLSMTCQFMTKSSPIAAPELILRNRGYVPLNHVAKMGK